MILSELEIENFRILKKVSVEFHPALNLITGDNGSGKSSILEAIYCLASGHSFRTRKPRELVDHASEYYQITSVFYNKITEKEHRCGLLREKSGAVQLRLDYEDIKRQSDIAFLLPVKALTPDSHKLVQDGPDERRQFLDWGLFHVEPSFLGVWKDYKRALSQRNQLLRTQGSDSDIALWTIPLAKAATALTEMRVKYTDLLTVAFQHRISTMNVAFEADLKYKQGFVDTDSIESILQHNLDHHRRMKTTTDGPHRADLQVSTDRVLSKQLLSRGQQKMLVYLLHLAQLDVLREQTNARAIVLCDDLSSELDANHTTNLLNQLEQLESQVFVSGVDLSVLTTQSNTRFHMEHGSLRKGL